MYNKIIAAGLFAICPETERYLLLKRRDGVSYPNYWGFPGGLFDEGDLFPKATAIREFCEETGYNGAIKISKEPLFIDKNNVSDFYVYVGVIVTNFDEK